MTDALYIHIPFCRKKCGYCDFLSFSCQDSEVEKYISYLKKEINLYPNFKYDTVYFGGGTPSILKVEDFYSILNNIEISEEAEVTVEVNPATVDLEKLKNLRKTGVNRISIGIQSFNDERLGMLGRVHSREEAVRAFSDAREAGFENISIDLIFATPGQTMEELQRDLEMVKELDPEHVSIYSLIWEEGTRFWDLLQEKKLSICNEELEERMYTEIIESLSEMGYLHYEVSNFSKPGLESRHNSKYWLNKEYLGLGLGASGYLDKVRYKNSSEFEEYYDKIDSCQKPLEEEEHLDDRAIAEYGYILGLRLLNVGIKPDEEKYLEICSKLEKRGYLRKNSIGSYVLTKTGLFLANDVFEEFID